MRPQAVAARRDDICHILPTVTDTGFAISISVEQPRSQLQRLIDGNAVDGVKKDSKGDDGRVQRKPVVEI